jgi:adrenodoxin-NADP+ reductase
LTHVSGSGSSDNPLQGVYQALALVGWYNGHPAFADSPVNLENITDVSVVGQGNVALDVARILLKNPSELDETDMPTEVLDVLHSSKVKTVTAVGRRGPAQVAFTTKELREMVNLDGVGFAGVQGQLMNEAKQAVENDRVRKRMLGLMEKPSKAYGSESTTREFKLDFLKSPKTFVPSDSDPTTVGSVEWQINTLLSQPNGSMPNPPPPSPDSPSTPAPMTGAVLAAPTGEVVTMKADMVVESVGYRSEGLAGEGWMLPFDERKGRVRNVGGRVVTEEGAVVSRLSVKREL